jgi:hypothetical protein
LPRENEQQREAEMPNNVGGEERASAGATTFWANPPPRFDPKSCKWDSWIQQFSSFLDLSQVEVDKMKRAMLVNSVEASTFNTVAAYLLPKTVDEMSFDELKGKMAELFKVKNLKVAERFRFFRAMQDAGETLIEFSNRLKLFASTCEFPQAFYDDALVIAFIMGMKSESHRKKLLEKAELKFDRALEIARSMEQIEEDAKRRGHSAVNAEDEQLLAVHKVSQSRNDQKMMKGGSQDSRSYSGGCWRCTGDHSPSDCRFRLATCNKCESVGHIAKTCRQGPKESKAKPDSNRNRDSRYRGRGSSRDRDRESSRGHAYGLNGVYAVGSDKEKVIAPVMVQVNMNGREVPLEFDPGADLTFVTERTWIQIGRPPLKRWNIKVVDAGGWSVRTKGRCDITIEYWGSLVHCQVYVMSTGTDVMGRDLIYELGLDKVSMRQLAGRSNNSPIVKNQAQIDDTQRFQTEDPKVLRGRKAPVGQKTISMGKFAVGDKVSVREFRRNRLPWTTGRVLDVLAEKVLVQVGPVQWSRKHWQVRYPADDRMPARNASMEPQRNGVLQEVSVVPPTTRIALPVKEFDRVTSENEGIAMLERRSEVSAASFNLFDVPPPPQVADAPLDCHADVLGHPDGRDDVTRFDGRADVNGHPDGRAGIRGSDGQDSRIVGRVAERQSDRRRRQRRPGPSSPLVDFKFL